MTDLRQDLERATRTVAPPEDAYERLMQRRTRRARGERIAAAALSLAVAGVALGATMVALRGTGAETRPGAGPDPSAGLAMAPGQYSYTRTTRISPTGEVTIETWWALDGSGRIEVAGEDPGYGLPVPGGFGPGAFPVDGDLSELSTDPGVLAGQLRARSAENGASPQPAVTPGPGQAPETGGLWRAVRHLLASPNATPELRAALFEVASGLDTVERIDGGVDPVGRAAVELRIATEGYTHQVFFDPDSLQLMAVVERPDEGSDPSLSPAWYEIVTDAGFTSSTGEVPAASDRFFPGPQAELPAL